MVVAGRLARRVEQISDQFEQEIKPLFGHLNAIGRDAARAAELAAGQVERADRVFADAAQKVEQTLTMIQGAILAPAREGKAVVSGFRAAMAVLRELRIGRSGQRRSDDEDALFI
jgi:ornithine cyclodeaminase/alanine dehydrogenase-like protein (mu-crystallin family)